MTTACFCFKAYYDLQFNLIQMYVLFFSADSKNISCRCSKKKEVFTPTAYIGGKIYLKNIVINLFSNYANKYLCTHKTCMKT